MIISPVKYLSNNRLSKSMEIEMESHAMQNAPLGENSIQHKTQNRKAPIYVRGMLKKGNKKKITKTREKTKPPYYPTTSS